MWILRVLDYRSALSSFKAFGEDERDWAIHGPFKTIEEGLKWWDKICDDIYSEAEADYGKDAKYNVHGGSMHVSAQWTSLTFSVGSGNDYRVKAELYETEANPFDIYAD